MVKVLEVVGRMDRAGQETFLMNILRKADREKYEISFSVNTNYIGAYEDEIKNFNCQIYHNPFSADIKHLSRYIKCFRKILKENGPFDVVHCHTWLFGGFIMWAAKKEHVPVRIMHSHSTSDGYGKSIFRRLYRSLAKKLIRNNATCMVACGVDAYYALFNKKCIDKNKILNNAVDVDQFDDRNFDVGAYRRTISIAKNSEVIISVARFYDVKNHKKIINVFYQYQLDHDKAVLLLVGEGELKDEAIEQVNELGISEKVYFMGVRSDVNKLLMCSNVFIMPSKFEGLPVSLIEAQAAGVYCVISNSITDEVDMGLALVDKVDITKSDKEWSDAIEVGMNQKKPDFSFRKEKLTEHGYSIDSTWRKLEMIYDKNKRNIIV